MPSYERYETRRRQTYGATSSRTTWGYWIPLAVTVGVATAGVAAWIWNERKDDEDDDHDYPPPRTYNEGPPPGAYPPTSAGPGYGPPPETAGGQYNQTTAGMSSYESSQKQYTTSVEQRNVEDEGIVSRVSGALRRTPSPQQIFDVASKRVTAGVAAAGAAVGGALASISEEGKGDYEDHSRWSEEADSQNGSSKKGPKMRDAEAGSVSLQTDTQNQSSRKRSKKTVAIIISAENDHQYEEDASYHQEHASILSHLPEHVDEDSRVFVLIYDPSYRGSPSSVTDQPPQSMTSSYSNIGHEDAQSPGQRSPQGSRAYNKLFSQAQTLVEKETMIMPFTSPTGYLPMLREIDPQTVYVQASLAGARGEQLDALSWVAQVVLVVGDESGHGGLVDSEDERGEDAQDKWWLQDSRIGLGKGIEVVEGLRIGEDWVRRIKGHD